MIRLKGAEAAVAEPRDLGIKQIGVGKVAGSCHAPTVQHPGVQRAQRGVRTNQLVGRIDRPHAIGRDSFAGWRHGLGTASPGFHRKHKTKGRAEYLAIWQGSTAHDHCLWEGITFLAHVDSELVVRLLIAQRQIGIG